MEKILKRSCENCTKCCEGFLSGEVNGKNFYPGNPCHFVVIGKGCSIYKDRPKDPCVSYQCAWRNDDFLPMWMKPNLINTIIDWRETDGGIKYLCAREAGEKMNSTVLTWLIEYCIINSINFLWYVDGGEHWIGTEEFLLDINKNKK